MLPRSISSPVPASALTCARAVASRATAPPNPKQHRRQHALSRLGPSGWGYLTGRATSGASGSREPQRGVPRFPCGTSNSFPASQNRPSPQPSSVARSSPSTSRCYSLFSSTKMASASTFYDFKPLDKRGQEHPLSEYKGKVVLIVNTASKCGFTPQYAGLESLYKKLTEKHPGEFVILGFPCNQFGSQEPGTDDDVQNFCQVNYGVSFPIMKKTDVNGDNAEPLFTWLKEEKPGLMGLKRVKWNFEKFLVGRDGKVKNRWASTTKPEALEQAILEELNKA